MLPGMRRTRREDGQAAVELIALLPLAALVLAVAWQLVVAGHAVWSAGAAARSAARAAALGHDARRAAQAALPRALGHGLRVRDRGGGEVRVEVRIPRVFGLPSVGHVGAAARFREQR
jgi:hypothetical protein